jgi:serine protease Do
MKVISLLLTLLLSYNVFAEEIKASDSTSTIQNTIQPPTFADIVEPLIPTVVNIYTEQHVKIQKERRDAFPMPFNNFNELFKEFEMPFLFDDIYSNPKAVALGSGFIIDKNGYIVTNSHVVDNAEKINIKLFDNTELEAQLIGIDKKTDLALLKVEAKKDLPFAIFGDDQKTRVGDWIIAIGNPFGLNHTVTKGIVSSKARDIDLDSEGIVNNYVQTDAPINRGNSGGPMFNLRGEVIGVNTSIYSTSGSNAGIGFAIPSQTVQKVVDQLKKFGKVNRGVLNIIIQQLTPEILEGLGLKDQKGGVLVTEVKEGGAGEKAGLKSGDIILELNGKKVSSPRELQVLVAEAEVNSTATILVLRNGQKKELKTTIVLDAVDNKISDDIALSDSTNPKAKLAGIVEINGVSFADLSNENIDKYQVDTSIKKGAIVTNISKNSMWRQYIKLADVIINVNQQEVSNSKDIAAIFSASKDKRKNIIFVIKRRNTNVFLALPVTQ